MDSNRTVNYTTKHISEFTPEDTIYIAKMVSGYQYMYFCQFIKFEKGMVYGKPISVDREYVRTFPEEIKSRLNKCYLWGIGENSSLTWEHCHWFTKNGIVEQ